MLVTMQRNIVKTLALQQTTETRHSHFDIHKPADEMRAPL